MNRWAGLALSLALTGCGTAPAAAPLPPTAVPVSPIVPSIVASVASANPTPTQAALPAGWQAVEWEGLRVPLPRDAAWTPAVGAQPPMEGVTVLADAAIEYPPAPQTVERPYRPSFMIVAFEGAAGDWLDRLERSAPLAVDRSTVQDTAVAGLPAKRFHAQVVGLCDSATYVVVLQRGRLLLIETGCPAGTAADQVVSAVALAQP